MPKNKGKGGKNRRRGKNENEYDFTPPPRRCAPNVSFLTTNICSNEKRELTFKEDGQEYAQVLKMLGNGRLEAMVC